MLKTRVLRGVGAGRYRPSRPPLARLILIIIFGSFPAFLVGLVFVPAGLLKWRVLIVELRML